jgi:tyrosine-protein phosphatase SIW14
MRLDPAGVVRVRAGLAAVCVALIVALAACASRPTSQPARQWTQPCDECIQGVANFTKVTEKLWRGTQPDRNDPEAFRRLEAAGVKTVINLRHDHDDFPLLRDTKMHYVWIPMRAWYPETEELVLFLSALRRLFADPHLWPVYVHCAEGRDRTGYAIAAYRIIEEGWDADDAIQEMFDFRYNTVWFANPSYLRSLKQQSVEIGARVKRAP